MPINQPVTLKTFLGKTKPEGTPDRENYWKLIGQKGRIIEDNGDERVLVLFDCNLDEYQVENHNPIKNSLWINTTDLEFEDE